MNNHNPATTPYFRCRKPADKKSCEGWGTLRVREVEQSTYSEMIKKMAVVQALTGGNPIKANPTVEDEIEELDTKRQSLAKVIADMSAETVSPKHMKRISGYLDNWENVDFENKGLVADRLISTIRATSESVQIEWKI